MSKFQEDLFGCFSECLVCLWGCCIPGGVCCMQALAVDKALGTGAIVPYILVWCLWCIGGTINRGKIRTRYGLSGGVVEDCLIWTYCWGCAGCQEYREVQKRTNL